MDSTITTIGMVRAIIVDNKCLTSMVNEYKSKRCPRPLVKTSISTISVVLNTITTSVLTMGVIFRSDIGATILASVLHELAPSVKAASKISEFIVREEFNTPYSIGGKLQMNEAVAGCASESWPTHKSSRGTQTTVGSVNSIEAIG